MLLIKLVNLSLCYPSTWFHDVSLGIRVWFGETVPLLESDGRNCSGITKSLVLANQLKDMISFYRAMDVLEVNGCSRKEDEMKDA